MITAENICQRIVMPDGELDILKNVSFNMQSGDSVAIVGASGSGKSTLLGMLAGLDVPSSGKIVLNDEDITALDEEARAKVRADNVAFVFQNFQLLDSLNALENTMLPLEVRGAKDAQALAQRYLERVGLAERQRHYPRQLSGGEQQRVALARAFACEAPILFADEPTGSLDANTGNKVAELLFEMNSEARASLVLVTHDMHLARRCDRQFEMAAGEIREVQTSNETH